jgi:altronate dehydratase
VVTGCDSTITTNVTVNPLLFSTVDEVICEGESVTLPDGTSTVSAAGSYDVTLASVVTGCDSTITTNVTVNPLLFSTVDEVICEGESVTLPDGSTVSAAGSYDVTLASVVTGCDSTITTNVTVNPLLFSTVDEVICEGESVTLPDGSTVSAAGSYDVTLASVVTGCDSTITTNVTVNPLLFSTVDEVICEGESVTLPDGSTVSAAGSYDVTLASVVTGCDSTITTNVTVNPLLFSTVDEVICEGESVTLPDGSTVSAAVGSYDVTLASVVTGCDSTITTNVTVNPLLFSTVDEVICEGESVTLPDGTSVSAAGSYDVTLKLQLLPVVIQQSPPMLP